MNTGRRVVITAGAGGIGLAMAQAFAANGDRVHICDINEQALKEITEQNAAKPSREVTSDALSVQAIKRFVDPADIAALALFLASDQAKSISGQTIPIDGDSSAAS